MKAAVFIVVVIALGAVGYWLVFDGSDNSSQSRGGATTPLVDIVVAETLSPNAQIGKTAFESKCAGCHGVNAVGQDGVAPPLVHVIYEPSHHGDESFQRAIAVGVRGHHWPFGDMPPVEGLTRGDAAMIISYVRELQRFNGIN